MHVPRRSMLAGVTAAVLAAAGCVGQAAPGDDPDDTDSDPGTPTDSEPALTDHAVSERAVRATSERYSDMDPRGLYLGSAAAVETHFGDVEDDTVAAFVEETAFEAGERLVYLESFGPQTCYELVLSGAPAVSEDGVPTVTASLNRTAGEDEPCGDAITPVLLLVRLSFDADATVPDAVQAEVPGRGDADTLELSVER